MIPTICGQPLGLSAMPFSIERQVETPFDAILGPFGHHLVVLNLTGSVRGTFRVDERSGSKLLPAGRLTYWPAGKGFRLNLQTRMESLHLKIGTDAMRQMLQAAGIVAETQQLTPVFGEEDALLEQLMLEAWRVVQLEAPVGDVYLSELTRAIVARLTWRCLTADTTDAAHGLTTHQLRRIDQHIAERLDQPISLDDLSALLRKSTSHFSRQFKLAAGQSPYQYILHKRIERARDLLSGSDKSIVEISLDCGFSHQEHLTHTFRKLTGMTPGRYRRRNRDPHEDEGQSDLVQ